ncbi:MAG TPA: hypothetical protein VEL76_37795 [Gemmataceae bacterium]|nr:hypothetical protein [Gemmataceae bacterium]
MKHSTSLLLPVCLLTALVLWPAVGQTQKVKLPPLRSRAEAHFWLVALTSRATVERFMGSALVKRARTLLSEFKG